MFDPREHNPSSGVSKIFDPGEHIVRILEMTFDIPNWDASARYIVLHLEGEPMGEDFEGLPVDKDRPELGNYAGQIARVKAMRYAFKDGEYQGRPISRDKDIFNWLMGFAQKIGKYEQMQQVTRAFATIDEFFDFACTVLCDPNNWLRVTLGGREYAKDNGHTGTDLHFPKKEKDSYPYTLASNTDLTHFLRFDERHIERLKPAEPVAGFGGQAGPPQAGPPQAGPPVGPPPLTHPQAQQWQTPPAAPAPSYYQPPQPASPSPSQGFHQPPQPQQATQQPQPPQQATLPMTQQPPDTPQERTSFFGPPPAPQPQQTVPDTNPPGSFPPDDPYADYEPLMPA